MANMNQISWRRWVLASVYVIVGTAQLAVGFITFFSHLLPWSSSLWTGTINLIFGILLISILEKPRLLVAFYVSTILVNILNLLILELVEWKILVSKDAFSLYLKTYSLKFIIASYLASIIPSLIIVFKAILAIQCRCCIFIMKKIRFHREKSKILSRVSDGQIYYNWVFNESEPNYHSIPCQNVRSCKLYDAYADNEKEEMIGPSFANIDDSVVLRKLSSFRVVPSVHSKRCSSVNFCRDYEKNCDKSSLTLSSYEPKDSIKSSRVSRSVSEVSYRPFVKTLTEDNVRRHSSIVFVPPDQPSPKPFDTDSLVNLKRLELLARQWRFQAQHKALHRQFSFQSSQNQRHSTQL